MREAPPVRGGNLGALWFCPAPSCVRAEERGAARGLSDVTQSPPPCRRSPPRERKGRPHGSNRRPGEFKRRPGEFKRRPGESKGRPGESKGRLGESKRRPGELKRLPGESKRRPGEFKRRPGETKRLPEELKRLPGELKGRPGALEGWPGELKPRPHDNGNYRNAAPRSGLGAGRRSGRRVSCPGPTGTLGVERASGIRGAGGRNQRDSQFSFFQDVGPGAFDPREQRHVGGDSFQTIRPAARLGVGTPQRSQ